MSIDTHIETAGSLLFEMPRVRKTVVREEKCACDGKRERERETASQFLQTFSCLSGSVLISPKKLNI